MPNIDVDLITTREAADLLNEGVRQTIRRVERNELAPAKKLPGLRGSYLFNRSDIEAIHTSPAAPTAPESVGSAGASSRKGQAA